MVLSSSWSVRAFAPWKKGGKRNVPSFWKEHQSRHCWYQISEQVPLVHISKVSRRAFISYTTCSTGPNWYKTLEGRASEGTDVSNRNNMCTVWNTYQVHSLSNHTYTLKLFPDRSRKTRPLHSWHQAHPPTCYKIGAWRILLKWRPECIYTPVSKLA